MMFGLNLNLIHNLINVIIVGLGAILLSSGCVTDAVTAALDCTKSWIDPKYTTIAITVLGGLKVVLNIFRDGLFGLWKVQPPVQK